jgi:hypothetical protein
MPTPSKIDSWKRKRQAGGHVTLPSGTEVRIEVPDIMDMLGAGTVPNELVKFAVEASESMALGAMDLDAEKFKEAANFKRWVIATTVKEPDGVEPDDIPALPTEDADMLFEFAMRQRDTDALGKHLHGLEKVAEWRQFRLGR